MLMMCGAFCSGIVDFSKGVGCRKRSRGKVEEIGQLFCKEEWGKENGKT